MFGFAKSWGIERVAALVALLGGGWAQADYVLPAQFARYQPGLLRGSRPFTVKGHATAVGKSRIATQLLWLDGTRYQMSLSGIPKSFYNGSAIPASTWTLFRDGRNCVIKTDAMVVNCPQPTFWAQLELLAQPEASAKALQKAGFLNASDLVAHETDSRKPPSRDPRISPNVGTNGNTPVAVVEVHGENLNAPAPGEEYPLIQYDQTFLSPLLARWAQDGEIVTIRASADLGVRRDHRRGTHVLANHLDISFGKTLVASFDRGDEKPVERAAGTPTPRAATDVGALRAQLNSDGQAFLNAWLLSH